MSEYRRHFEDDDRQPRGNDERTGRYSTSAERSYRDQGDGSYSGWRSRHEDDRGPTRYGSARDERSGERGGYGREWEPYGADERDWRQRGSDDRGFGGDRSRGGWQGGGFGGQRWRGEGGYGQPSYGDQQYGDPWWSQQGGAPNRGDWRRRQDEGDGEGYQRFSFGGRAHDYDPPRDGRAEQQGWQSGGRQSTSFAGRGPKDYSRSDERIREDLSDRLTDDPRVDASEISVQVKSGEVTLTGTVPSREHKRYAEDCAESISGVREVTNNLRIARNEDSRGHASGSSTLSGTGPTTQGSQSRSGQQRSATTT